MSARDKAYEADFLERAEREAGLMGLGFPEQVQQRLDNYGRVYGDRFVGYTLRQLLQEIREEGIDSAAWSVLLAQVLLLRGGAVDDDVSMEARMLLQAIAAEGAKVENLCRQLAELLAE